MVLAASAASVPTTFFSRTEIAWSASCFVGTDAKPADAHARRRRVARVRLMVGKGSFPRPESHPKRRIAQPEWFALGPLTGHLLGEPRCPHPPTISLTTRSSR